MSTAKLSNLIGYDEYVNEDLIDDEFDYDYDMEDDDDDNLYEASMRNLTSAEKKKRTVLIGLMTALNKKPSYLAAKSKFMKIFHTEAKRVVSENGLNPKVLKELNKVTLREIE